MNLNLYRFEFLSFEFVYHLVFRVWNLNHILFNLNCSEPIFLIITIYFNIMKKELNNNQLKSLVSVYGK